MYKTEELIRALGKVGITDVGEIAEEVDLCEDIRRRVLQNRKLCREEEKRHEENLDELRSQLWDIWIDCPHHLTTYTPDASGNNDSSVDCDICGKEL